MSSNPQRVVVVGASPNPERYSNRAVRMLLDHGHEVIPVHPAVDVIHGVPVVKSLAEVDGPVDTVTLYVSPALSKNMEEALVALRPRRVIFNPGTENAELQEALARQGVAVEEACTLVLLQSGQF